MRRAVVLAAVLAGLALGYAGRSWYLHDNRPMEVISPTEAPIEIKINPEARVSVSITGAWPPPAPCGTAVALPIEIKDS